MKRETLAAKKSDSEICPQFSQIFETCAVHIERRLKPEGKSAEE
jgi:hypothetical protein